MVAAGVVGDVSGFFLHDITAASSWCGRVMKPVSVV